jgi:uncharacterized phage-associated protein
LLDRAIADGEYLQPQKLHRLMYLAQAYYGVARHGEKLMPATFVAEPEGPIEPTLFRAFARGRPAIDVRPLDEHVVHVLDSVWRQFGAHSIDHLNKLIQRHPPFADALATAPSCEIGFETMVAFYGTQGLKRRPNQGTSDAIRAPAPAVDQVLRPRTMRNHDGKTVSVRRWAPKRADSA